MKTKIILVAGARPNFMKIAPLMREFSKHKSVFEIVLVHTGQHYDFAMSEVFFRNLGIPRPHEHLNCGSGSHSVQTANIMTSFEKVLVKELPALVVVVGDVNSTLACSLVASKMRVKVAHVEAGLRSFDRLMPEEINRIVTDSISDYLFVSEPSGVKNLKHEGVPSKKVFFVGNVMIDTLLSNMPKINASNILMQLGLTPNSQLPTPNCYAVLTLHRPSNVDSRQSLSEIYNILKEVTAMLPVVYPIHPRAAKMMKGHGLWRKFKALPGLKIISPLGYIDFIKLVKESKFILTDSGGIQEEATVLKVPCLTMRENTERPVTITEGSNILVGRDKPKILKAVKGAISGGIKKTRRPALWDGRSAKRIVDILERKLRLRA